MRPFPQDGRLTVAIYKDELEGLRRPEFFDASTSHEIHSHVAAGGNVPPTRPPCQARNFSMDQGS